MLQRYCAKFSWRYDIQQNFSEMNANYQNETQQNNGLSIDIQQNDYQLNDNQHNDILHNINILYNGENVNLTLNRMTMSKIKAL